MQKEIKNKNQEKKNISEQKKNYHKIKFYVESLLWDSKKYSKAQS